jgi:formylglycine-generating enzyme required for sulfatase activity
MIPEVLASHPYSFETVQLNMQGELVQKCTGQAHQAVEDLGKGVQIELVAVAAGFFQMGSRDEGSYADERPLHPVFLKSFWMGKYPITQAQWQEVMGSLPDCRFHGPTRPVDNICWRDAAAFCQQLSKRTGRDYRLPSEAEWEYACRAGTITPFNLGETLTTNYANYVGDHTYRDAPQGVYRHGTTPVGAFPPNRWGLYDMHGNVWEFCTGHWTDDYVGAPVDGSTYEPEPHASNTDQPHLLKRFLAYFQDGNAPARSHTENTVYRVARGGSWHETPNHCRSAVRLRVPEDERLEYYGLRVSTEMPENSPFAIS